MQLSTNRVNFTNTSVAQFNYVTFLSHFRSRKKGVQDIGNIVRLHNDGYTTLKGFSLKTKFQRAVSKCLEKNRAVVLYVRRKLRINVPQDLQWYRFVIFVLNKGNEKIVFECDMRTCVIIMNVYIKRETALCTMNTAEFCFNSQGNVHKSKFSMIISIDPHFTLQVASATVAYPHITM